ncbi:hypothetical protein [Escherichia sp. HH26CH]|uniref:hypothetical protein n=1 Tax=Escherichia sp. HH26CH TaxID=2508713 RepID=UPI0013A031EF|nr:hypothetical protein [Escherichia sp. HH26CH]MXC83835.1 hypothetical protein [Escherichia sp. HH26CH]
MDHYCTVRDSRAGGRINARLPAPGKDRAPVALKGAALTRRPLHYADILLWASVFSDLSFVCY